MSGALISSEQFSEATDDVLTLVDALRRRALKQPDRVAYTFLGDGERVENTLTYSELDLKARVLGAYLRALGVEGGRVVLLYPPGIEYIAAFFGCLYAGAVAVPAYPPGAGRYLERLRAIITDSQAAVALTAVQVLSRLKPHLERVPEFRRVRWVTNESCTPKMAEDWRAPELYGATLAFLQYTSGSTAQPKGVMVSHANLLHNQKVIQQMFRQTENSVIVGWLPLYHDMGLIGNVIQALYVGAPCILMSPVSFLQKPVRWLRAISDYGATTSGGPNFAYDLCLRKVPAKERETLDLSAWSVAFNGAEPIRAETVDRFAAYFAPSGFHRDAFHPCYGLAEGTLAVTAKSSDLPAIKTVAPAALEYGRVVETDGKGRSLVGCGGGAADQVIVIVDPISGLRRAPDEVGEIWISGPSVAQGYWNRPEETEETFRAYLLDSGDGPFLRTGDLGFQRDGELFVTGRLKDLIIIRGRNYYAQDIERTVEECGAGLRPGCGAAFSVEIGGEERLVIAQEFDRHQKNLDDLIGAIVQAVVEEHEIQPYAVRLISPGSIPKTSSGKIQRHACRRGFLDGTLSPVAEWRIDLQGNCAAKPGPTSPVKAPEPESNLVPTSEKEAIEAWLKSLVAGKLRIDESSLDVNRSLARYGLDSLGAVELAFEIESAVGSSLSSRYLLDGITLTQLAARIAAGQGRPGEDQNGGYDSSAEPSGEYTLSYGQQALWVLYRMSPESPAYNLSTAMRIRSPLDVRRLRGAFQGLVDRHPMLRTTFGVQGGEPFQQIWRHVEICFREIDARTWTEAELNARLGEEARRPFNLEETPPLRVLLFTGSEGGPVLLMTAHHIIADLRSLSIALRELNSLYSAVQPRDSVPAGRLAPLSSFYTDYVQAQRRRVEGPAGERLWSYWQKECAGELPLLEMPTDRPRPQLQSGHGAAHAFTIEAALKEDLKAIARRYEATLFMMLLSVFDTLLYRYTGQEDLMVGSPTAGRNRPQLAGLIGYFVNPVVIRTNLSGKPRFSELLLRVRRSALGAMEHQDYPFALLVDRVQPVRDPSRTPLFQVMFVLQQASPAEPGELAALAVNHPGARIKLDELHLESVALDKRVAQFDLTLIMAETEQGLAGSMEYNADLFDAVTVGRLADHYRRLLESLVAEPEAQVAEAPMLSAEERRQILIEWNQTAEPFPAELCIHDLFLKQVASRPEAVALICGEEALTYAELNRRANQVARCLRGLGVRPESLVGLMVRRSLGMVAGMLGILKAGGGYLPLDPAYPRERLAFMLQDASVKALLTDQGSLAMVPAHASGVICLDSEWESIARQDDGELEGLATPSNLAYLIYTSGSTGRPKGVMIEHYSAVSFLNWSARAFTSEQFDGVLASTSICFDLSIFELFGPLIRGGRVALAENVLELPSLPLASSVSLINTVPSAIVELIRMKGVPASVRTINLAGEALKQGLAEDIHNLPGVEQLWNLYGPSEDTTYSTFKLVARRADRPPTIGRPISNTQVYLLGVALEVLPIGVDGELYLGGDGLARGYLGQPELTAERFIPNPFSGEGGRRLYRTGDVARYLKDGEIDYQGRADHQVKIRGYRIELGEIEAVIEQHESVRRSVVVVREEGGEKRLVAYVVGNAGAEGESGLWAYLRMRLPGYMAPEAIVRIDEIPLTPNGKVDRKRLPAPARGDYCGSREVSGPRTETERRVAEIFKEILGVSEIGIHDGFFEMGGHSLRAVRLLSWIQNEWGIALPLRKIFEFPTAEGLAEVIAEATAKHETDDGPKSVGRGAPLPLSFAQQRMWFLHQLEPEGGAYNIAGGVRLRGELNEKALSRALNGMVQRHEALRTRYQAHDGWPVQVIEAEREVELTTIDLEGWENPDQELERLALEEARKGFDLEKGPVMRQVLARMGKDEHALLVTIHHIAADGWSLGVLMKEVGALYEEAMGGPGGGANGAERLRRLKIQYGDYAVWQRERLKGRPLEKELSYWRERLAGAPAELELPSERARPAAQNLRGERLRVELELERKSDFERIGREAGATLFMVLLAGFKTLLWKYSGQEDILIGTPVANRERGETQGLIGLFVNTLVIRTRLEAGMRFRDLVREVRSGALGAYEHQELPFEKLVEELHPERSLSRSPIFQVMFSLEQEPEAVEMAGLKTTPLRVDAGIAKFDLILFMEETERGLRGALEYDSNLFRADSMVRMGGHLGRLFESVARDPDRKIGEVEMLSEREKYQILFEWNRTAIPYPREALIHELFEQQVETAADAVAVVYEDEQVTYEDLNRRANRLARRLRERGSRPDLPVVLCLERGLDMIVAMLATLKTGGAYVPLDPTHPGERLAFILGETGASIVLTHQRFIEKLSPNIGRVLCLDREAETMAREDAGNLFREGDPDNLAYVIYTSGSTGRPKGVSVAHRGVVRLVRSQSYARLGDGEIFLQLATVSFDASTFEIWGCLLNGGRLIIVPGRDLSLRELGETLLLHRVSILWLTAGLFHLMVDERIEDLKGVRQLLAGGDVLSPRHVRESLDKLESTSLINGYGPTECATFSCCHLIRKNYSVETSVPIGRPISNTRTYVLDRSLQAVAVGIVGTLYIGGDGLARGYLNQPTLTAEKFIPDPFAPNGGRLYESGDRARFLTSGELEFIGRRDHQVKIRGFRVELGEIEAVLEEYESVRQSVALVREQGGGEKQLVAYVVQKAGSEVSVRGLKEYLKKRVPEYMAPAAIVELKEMPLTPNGKVDYKALPAPARTHGEREAGILEPRTEIERRAAEIFKEMLGVEEISIDDSFFDLGGHSLLATRLLSRIQDEWGIALPLRRVFEFPTVEGMAGIITEAATENRADEGPRKTGRGAPLPLSFAQQRMWFLHQLEPKAGVYNIAGGVRLRGELNERALSRALNGVVQRHEALRTRYEAQDGGPAQVIDNERTIELSIVIIEGDANPEQKFAAVAEEEAGRGFDLERGPVLRLALVRISKNEHVLLVTVHHIAADAWSLGVLVEEAGRLYAEEVARERGEDSGGEPLKKLEIQYADYAVWQRERLGIGKLEEELRYWRERLEGAPHALELPADRARPVAQSYRGRRARMGLGSEIKGQIERVGRETGATLFMALIAGLRVLLWKYSGQEDLLIGTPMANRERAEIQGVIGFFVNTLVMRNELRGDLTFRELVGREREAALGAFARQELPFEKLVEELSPQRSVDRSPLFQVMFVLHDVLRQRPQMPGLETELISIDNGTSKFDLTLMVEENGERLSSSMEYNLDIFDQATIDRMLGHFNALLRSCVAHPMRRLAELSLLTEAERRQIIGEWNDTKREYPLNRRLHEWFDIQAARVPDAVAVVFEDEQISYWELNDRANRLARHLEARGVEPGMVVAALMERSVEIVIGLLGILKAGGAYLPLDPDYPQERLDFMTRDARVSILLTQERLLDKAPDGPAAICLDRDRELFSGEARSDREGGIEAEDLAYVIYTSGSTGVPKAAMNTHLGICNHLLWTQEIYQLTSGDVVLQKTPFSFDVSVWELFWPLISGARLIMARPGGHRESEYLAETIEKERITTLHFVPSMLQNFLEEGGASRCDSVRQVICSGEALSLDLQERFFKRFAAELRNLYGPTEAAVHVTSWTCERGRWRRSVPIGRPIANLECYVLDGVAGLTPVGGAGELYLGGAGLAWGYMGRPELTAEKFVPHPFSDRPGARLYRTGDLTRYLPEGEIEYLGRIDHQVKVRGLRIELGEIEAALAGYPRIREVVVTAREVDSGDRRLVAYLAADQPPPSSAELRDFLRARLPEFMIPSAFMFLEALPLSPNGKTDRRRLPEPRFVRQEERAPLAPPNELELTIAAVWREVLKVESVSLDDDFFDLGGHSLLMTRAHRRIRERLKRDVLLIDLFKHPTVSSLARHLRNDSKMTCSGPGEMSGWNGLSAEVIPPREPNEPAPLSFAQLRLWFQEEMSPETGFFNLPAAIRLQGGLDMAALEQSLGEIVRRHEILRTTFSGSAEEPLQIVNPSTAFSLPLVDLSALPGASARREARRLAIEEAGRPFDLGRGSLVRSALLKLDQEEHVWLWTMHHIVSDAYSLGVLTQELTGLYGAFSTGESSPLPELPIQYADFAKWQRAWLTGEALESQLSYWKRQLAGIPPLLELPTDRPRPPVQSTHGAALSFELPASLVEALRALSKRENCTLFMTLLAAFNTLLRRYTGQDDIVIGADIANRNRRELEGLIGFFVNMLVIRTDLSGNPSFLDLLGRVRKVTLESYAHQDLPFERLVEKLRPERNLAHSPLFQVVLNYYQAPADGLDLPGLTLTDLDLESQISRFDLSLFISDRAGRVGGHWRYSVALFDDATIALMHQRFEALLQRVAERPDARLNTLDLLTEAEKRRQAETQQRLKRSNFEKFKLIRPKAIDQSGSRQVGFEQLPGGGMLPLVIRPEMEEVDLVDWVRNNLKLIETRLLERGAILFRDFRVDSVDGFERFAKAFDSRLLDYTEPSSPRSEVRRNIYSSTEYPASQWIQLHNEMSYAGSWPHHVFFFCLQPASEGGATPLAFSRTVFDLIDPKIRERFMRKQVMYVRNFGDSLDLPWQQVFKTEERSEVERYCRAAAIDFRWVGEDRLTTRQIHQAVLWHPTTNDLVWFNQAHAFHSSSLEPAVRESLLAEKSEQELPRNAYYGDGMPIEDSVIAEIREAYRAATITFDWRRGDLLVIENMLVAHGRQPFTGARKILVAMSGLINSKDVKTVC